VNLLRDGKPYIMGKRSGNFITLKEVVDEVGRDACRFFFLMRRCDSQLDFDLELLGFEEKELLSFLPDTVGLTDDDAVPEPPQRRTG